MHVCISQYDIITSLVASCHKDATSEHSRIESERIKIEKFIKESSFRPIRFLVNYEMISIPKISQSNIIKTD
jgi:hypothetical protein